MKDTRLLGFLTAAVGILMRTSSKWPRCRTCGRGRQGRGARGGVLGQKGLGLLACCFLRSALISVLLPSSPSDIHIVPFIGCQTPEVLEQLFQTKSNSELDRKHLSGCLLQQEVGLETLYGVNLDTHHAFSVQLKWSPRACNGFLWGKKSLPLLCKKV